MVATWTIQGLLLGAIFVYHSTIVRSFVGSAVIIWYFQFFKKYFIFYMFGLHFLTFIIGL